MRGGKAERMAHAPFLLRIVYRIVPKRVADTLLPPESSLSRQVLGFMRKQKADA